MADRVTSKLRGAVGPAPRYLTQVDDDGWGDTIVKAAAGILALLVVALLVARSAEERRRPAPEVCCSAGAD